MIRGQTRGVPESDRFLLADRSLSRVRVLGRESVMGFFDWVVFVAAAAAAVALLRAVIVLTEEKSREEREQAAFERRGQAALEALRTLGRDYPRPKN
jgi:hypothetical protein